MPKIAYFHKKLTKVVTFDTAPETPASKMLALLLLLTGKMPILLFISFFKLCLEKSIDSYLDGSDSLLSRIINTS